MTPDIILQRTGIDVRAVEQGDDAWHKLRLGVITASEVHNVIAKPRSGKKWPDMKMSYLHPLLAEVCTGVAPEVNAKALAWGKQYENDARALFEFTSGVNVTESPIIYRDESMRTACSPDGLCSDGNGLELKCPFFHELVTPSIVLELLDERERNQQYIKRRDQENEDIALTVGKLRVELETAKSKLNEQREYYEGVISDGSKRIAKLESNEVREDGNQFLVVRHPGKTPVIKHCTGDLEEFLRQLIEQDPLVTIDIITHRYYGVGGQWVQDAGEYLHMMSDAGIRIKGE